MKNYIKVELPYMWGVGLLLVSLLAFGSISFLGYTTYRGLTLQVEIARAVKANMVLQAAALDAMGVRIDDKGNNSKVP